MVRPLSADSPVRYVARRSPSTVSEKYSDGPNLSAASASGGAIRVRPTRPTVPATKEPIAATPRAAPARPCFAIS